VYTAYVTAAGSAVQRERRQPGGQQATSKLGVGVSWFLGVFLAFALRMNGRSLWGGRTI